MDLAALPRFDAPFLRPRRPHLGHADRIARADGPTRCRARAGARQAATDPRSRHGHREGAIWLAERFPESSVVGVDLAPKMIAAAHERLPEDLIGRVRYEVADAGARLPFADAEFDLIAQVSVSAFFAETARVIGPGGTLVVVSRLGAATPAHTSPRLLRRGFERQGLEWIGDGAAGLGTYHVLRKPGAFGGSSKRWSGEGGV